jgi:hypothetical protein
VRGTLSSPSDLEAEGASSRFARSTSGAAANDGAEA